MADRALNASVEWSATGLPEGMNINSRTGHLIGRPAASAVGTHSPLVTVRTDFGTDTKAVGLEVYKPDRTPTPADKTVVLLHFDEDTVTDECGNTWTAGAGTPVVSNEQSVFGGKSLYCNGSCYIKTNAFTFSGDFTIDFWLYPTKTSEQHIIGQHKWGTNANFWVSFNNSKFSVQCNQNGYCAFGASTTDELNHWHHIAFVRSNSKLMLFVDGVLKGSGTYSNTINATYILSIGASQNNRGFFTGYIDEVRIVDGLACWTENFEPPTKPYELV